jgi:hypothetical protein
MSIKNKVVLNRTFFALLFIFSVSLPLFARAGIFKEIGELLLTLPIRILLFFAGLSVYLVFLVSKTILAVVESILNGIIAGKVTNFAYTQPGRNPIIYTGFQFTYPLANMVLVLGIIAIALATILRIAGYGAKKLLPIFIVVALLINFAPVALGLVVDVANVVLNYLLLQTQGVNLHIFSEKAQEVFCPTRFWSCMRALFKLHPDESSEYEICKAKTTCADLPRPCDEVCKDKGFVESSCHVGACYPWEEHAREGICGYEKRCCCKKYKTCEEACRANGYKTGECERESPATHQKNYPWDVYLEEGPCGGRGEYCYCKLYGRCDDACKANNYLAGKCRGDIGEGQKACQKNEKFLPTGPCEGTFGGRNCCCQSSTSFIEPLFSQNPLEKYFVLDEEITLEPKEEISPPKAVLGEATPVEESVAKEEMPSTFQVFFDIFKSLVVIGIACIFFAVVTNLVLLIYALLFLSRYLALWILTIIAPIAIVASIFPAGRKHIFDFWLKQFFAWAFIGVLGAFFIFLGMKTTAQIEEIIQFRPSEYAEVLIPMPKTEMEQLILNIKRALANLLKWFDDAINWLTLAEAQIRAIASVLSTLPSIELPGFKVDPPAIAAALEKTLITSIMRAKEFLLATKGAIEGWINRLAGPEDLEKFAKFLANQGNLFKAIGTALKDAANGILTVVGWILEILSGIPLVGQFFKAILDLIKGIAQFGDTLISLGDQMISLSGGLEKYALAETAVPGISDQEIPELDKIFPYFFPPIFMLLGLYFVLKFSGMFSDLVKGAALALGTKSGLWLLEKGKAGAVAGGKLAYKGAKGTMGAAARELKIRERAQVMGERIEKLGAPVVAIPFKKIGSSIENAIKSGEEKAQKLSRAEAARMLLRGQLKDPYANLGLLTGRQLNLSSLYQEAERMGYRGPQAEAFVAKRMAPILEAGRKYAPDKIQEILKRDPRFAKMPGLLGAKENPAEAIQRATKNLTLEDWKNLPSDAFKEKAVADAFLKQADIDVYRNLPKESQEILNQEILSRGIGGLRGTKLAQYIQDEKLKSELQARGWQIPKIEGGRPPTIEELAEATKVPEVKVTAKEKIAKGVKKATTLGAALGIGLATGIAPAAAAASVAGAVATGVGIGAEKGVRAALKSAKTLGQALREKIRPKTLREAQRK